MAKGNSHEGTLYVCNVCGEEYLGNKRKWTCPVCGSADSFDEVGADEKDDYGYDSYDDDDY